MAERRCSRSMTLSAAHEPPANRSSCGMRRCCRTTRTIPRRSSSSTMPRRQTACTWPGTGATSSGSTARSAICSIISTVSTCRRTRSWCMSLTTAGSRAPTRPGSGHGRSSRPPTAACAARSCSGSQARFSRARATPWRVPSTSCRPCSRRVASSHQRGCPASTCSMTRLCPRAGRCSASVSPTSSSISTIRRKACSGAGRCVTAGS